MKGIAAAFGLASAICVSAAFLHWSEQANGESCALQMEAAKAPIRGALSQASDAQLIYSLSGQLPSCSTHLSNDQFANGIVGGGLIGFTVYCFGLLFGRFKRWAQR
jgi:hypothetical protein